MLALILDYVTGTVGQFGMGVLYGLYLLFSFIPSLAVGVRRLHDTGRTGWWFLINLIPIIGGIWFLVLTLLEGDRDDNQYGPSPYRSDVGALA